MKELLILVSLLLSGVVSEPPAPYAPSGWRPNGPTLELPQKTQTLLPQQQEYLPAVDPRRPLSPNSFDNDADVSVQGLPSIEQQPIFELSPVNGQQYTGPSINADIGRLNPSYQQAQYQQQLEKARQFARQREFENTRARVPSNGLPNQQTPRQFASQTTTTTPKPELKTPQAETTTESINLNEGETLDSKATKEQKDEPSVEVSKQNLQEYPPEIFLSSLAQLKLQPQFVPLSQFGQLRAPLFYQPAQLSEARGFDGPAHLSALPSVLAQRELLPQQTQVQGQDFARNPIIVQQEQPTLVQEPVNQYQSVVRQYQPVRPVQPEQRVQPVLPVEDVDPVQDVQPVQSRQAVQTEVPAFPQFQAQRIILQQQPRMQIQPNNKYIQPQLQYQPQPQLQLQSEPVQPNQYPQPQLQYQPQPQQLQPAPVQPNQFPPPQLQYQPQPQQLQPAPVQPNQYPQPQLQYQPQPQLQLQPEQSQQNQYSQPQLQYQPQPQLQFQPQPNQLPQPQIQYQPQPQLQLEPQPVQPNQFPQPQSQYQPQPQQQPNQFLQPQRPKDVEEIEQTDQQVVYQNYQPQFYQPQANQYQNPEQPLLVAPPAIAYQNQEQFYQNQFPQQQYEPSQLVQPQDGQPLQSGLDINQQGNGIEQTEEQDEEQEDEGPKVTAVATAFGTRTQPRVFAQYGAPIPKVQENPEYQTTTETTAQDEAQGEDGPAIAQATAVATGRRNAKLRSRRVRPIFTVDRSGHLILAQQ